MYCTWGRVAELTVQSFCSSAQGEGDLCIKIQILNIQLGNFVYMYSNVLRQILPECINSMFHSLANCFTNELNFGKICHKF